MAQSRVIAHELDAAWIIALWKLIHGGDPPHSDQVAAAEIVSALAPVLAGQGFRSPSVETLERRFRDIGVEISVKPAEAPARPAAATEALSAIGIGWHYVEVCYGVPPNRRCVVVELPGTQGPPRPE